MSNDDKPKKLPANYYFDNEEVEKVVTKYHETGCTDVALRNEIMSHADQLIINVIRTHSLHNIYSGKDESSFNDLYQIAWIAIESALYKFKPGKAKIFNLFSQIARTSILAAIKKDNRDKKNSESYRYYLDEKSIKTKAKFMRFMDEVRSVCKYCEDFINITDALEKLYMTDNKPHEGLIGKLTEESDMSRAKVIKFIKILRLMSFEFTDSPVGEIEHQEKIIKPSEIAFTKDED
jgi:DNA-binding ferritin-like protein (Dps family)